MSVKTAVAASVLQAVKTMLDIHIIDSMSITPNSTNPECDIYSIYYRDKNGHKWLLYADNVRKGAMTLIAQGGPGETATINLNIELIASQSKSNPSLTLHDLETSATFNLYHDMERVLDKYRTKV